MTQDKIIEMARQAEILAKGEEWVFDMSNAIELTTNQKQLEAFAKLVTEKEREACEAVCNKLSANKPNEPTSFDFRYGAGCCAQAIRARGEA